MAVAQFLACYLAKFVFVDWWFSTNPLWPEPTALFWHLCYLPITITLTHWQ